ncbi:MAG: M23 family metallopeptidase [Pseudomonadales bacterium]|nr:M23 family metallopeptidase [Pseudomonadales bacterium]
MRGFIVFITLFLALTSLHCSAGIYKYKDENGNWKFSDKAPNSKQKTSSVETLHYKKAKRKAVPKVVVKADGDKYKLVVENPFYAPIEIKVKSSMFAGGIKHLVIDANSVKTLLSGLREVPEYRYYWVMGDPKARHEKQAYKFPVSSRKLFKITQSFNGRFSHSKRPNKYAVDIGMDIGTYIIAARGGTVIHVTDNFHLGAAKQYFIDKANVVEILHDDGTYATYAHILLGSAMVEPGDKVVAGDKIARSGTTGYSTGPHLHFVIRKNSGFRTVSQSFVYVDNTNRKFRPEAGMNIGGFND